MTSGDSLLAAAAQLSGEGRPYVLATVVNVRRPASTRRGDHALITPDGALSGWVGGACSEPIVVREALRSLTDGQPRLVRIAPVGDRPREEPPEHVVLAESHCASEGVVEVLIEPRLPKPLLAILGDSPAARTLAELTRTIGWRIQGELGDPDAVVVATMGRMDEDLLGAALRSGAGYVGLIASARRARAVLGRLRARGFSEEQLVRVRSPAGLDLGPGGQPEIAVAILAELVAWWQSTPSAAATPPARVTPPEAVDPVCGMTVAVASAGVESAVHRDVRYWFCGAGCRTSFVADPERYAGAGGAHAAPEPPLG